MGREIRVGATVMVGDSDVDVLTAKNCGAGSVGCLYGLAPHGLASAGADRLVDEPVELILDGRVVARGEAVIIDGNYGMRITEVLQQIVM